MIKIMQKQRLGQDKLKMQKQLNALFCKKVNRWFEAPANLLCREAYIQEKEVEITSSKVNKIFQMT